MGFVVSLECKQNGAKKKKTTQKTSSDWYYCGHQRRRAKLVKANINLSTPYSHSVQKNITECETHQT